MNKSTLKTAAALGMALTMMLSMTACGGKDSKKGGSDSSGKDYGDVKNMVFSGEDIDLSDVKGDPGSLVVSGDKIYFVATEWPEYDEEMYNDTDSESTEESSSDDADSASSEEDGDAAESTEEVQDEASDDKTSEDAGDDAASGEDADTDDASTEDTDSKKVDADSDTDVVESSDSIDEIQATTRIYSMNLDCTGITEICEPKVEANEYVNNIVVDKSGKLYLLTSSWDEKTETQSYYLASVDDSGNIADHKDISKAIGANQDTYISKIIVDDKGNYITITDQSVFILDSSLNKVAEIKNDNAWIEGAAFALDGSILCGTSDESGAVAQVLDIDNKKFGEKIKLDIPYFSSSDALISGNGDYDFFYKDDAGVYGYSLKDKKTTKIMDYLASEINSNYTYGLIPLNAESMIGTGWDDQTGKSVFTLYTKVDPSQVKDKTSIVLGSLWGVDETIRSAAIKFNKESDQYRIEFKDYSALAEGDNAWEDAIKKMNADIVAGNVPDIIDLSSLPVGQYAAKGILEDLTPYLEKDDTVSKDDILPSVEKAMEIDGKLYYIASSFGVQTLIASKDAVGDKTGWTFAELKELLEEKGDGVRPFYSENKVDIMNSFLYSCVDDYVDWTTGKCRFDSDDFKSILEISGKGSDAEMEYDEDSPSMPELIKSGKVLFSDSGWVDPDSVQLYKKMYNTDITFIGFPCEDRQGSYFSFTGQLGLYSKSDVKDGAWDFIKTFLTKDYQAGSGYMWNNPTNKEAFEAFMKTRTATKAYKDDYGNDIQPYENSWGWDDLEVQLGPMSADEEQMYRDLINNTTKAVSSDQEIMDIITEEAKNYFNGQKSLDETADIIQNRVTTYVNENR